MRKKMMHWLKRYLPAEIVAIIFSYVGFFTAKIWFVDLAVLAYASSWTETISYYFVIIVREYVTHKRVAQSKNIFRFAYQRFPKLMLEFGPSEFLDSLVIRPACIGFGVYYFGAGWGILIGKLVSDLAFYVPVIVGYEVGCYWERRRSSEG